MSLINKDELYMNDAFFLSRCLVLYTNFSIEFSFISRVWVDILRQLVYETLVETEELYAKIVTQPFSEDSGTSWIVCDACQNGITCPASLLSKSKNTSFFLL